MAEAYVIYDSSNIYSLVAGVGWNHNIHKTFLATI